MRKEKTLSNSEEQQAPITQGQPTPNADQIVFAPDKEAANDEQRKPQSITLPNIVPLQADEAIQATPISKTTAIISKPLSDMMASHKINAQEKEAWQHKSNEELIDISIFIDENGEIHHTLDLPKRKIIHTLCLMCFNEQENRKDTTAHGLLTKYTNNKELINESERRELQGVERATDFRCLDLCSLSDTNPKLTRQIIKTFRPEWESVEGFDAFETFDEARKTALFNFFNQGLHLIKFTMTELMTVYLGASKGRNYKEYQTAFADVINIYYNEYNKEEQRYIPRRLISDVHTLMDGRNKYYYLNLSPIFWKGIVRQWKMYPPIDINRQIVSQADEPTMILYDYIISQMRTNWNGIIQFGKLAEMLLPDDVAKGLQMIRIKEKLFYAFQVLTDNNLLLSNPIAPLMKDRTRADKLNQMEIRIEANSDIFQKAFFS